MPSFGIRGIAFAAALACLAAASPSRAANWFEMNFWLSGPRYDARLPACDNSWTLAEIQRKFATKEGRFWNSDLRLLTIEDIREVAFRPWAENTIPRRFCSGTVLVSDGKKRKVNYAIGEDLGIIGAIFGVEWCVVGLDRNWAYNPACKMAEP
ncbi:MAG: hypothetical protein HXY30_11805 [Pseudorhodoplanes sp.]|nr:hypothetical protein [Pseudorhodoplanes sp.]